MINFDEFEDMNRQYYQAMEQQEEETHKDKKRGRRQQDQEDLPEWYDHKGRFLPKVLADYILQNYKILFIAGQFYMYQDGVYKESTLEVGKLISSFLTNKQTPQNIENVRCFLRQESFLKRVDQLNTEHIINLKNCMLKLENNGFKKMQHTPDVLSSVQINAKLTGEGTGKINCPRFLTFLSEVLSEENIVLMQEIMGYFLVPGLMLKKIFILKGEANCGKSKFIEILEYLIGEENCSGITMQSLGDRFSMAQLYGKAANFCGDLPSKTLEDTGFLKCATGEDMITAEFKGKDHFNFKNKAKMMFACNALPKIPNDKSDGPYTRFLIMECKPALPAEKRDLFLMDKLKEEIDDILLFALSGLQRLMNNGWKFSENDDTRRINKQYKISNNNVLAFVEENCVVGESCFISSEKLYKEYKNFCDENGFCPSSSQKFAEELEGLKIHKKKTTKTGKYTQTFLGITTINEDENSGKA